MVIVVSNLRLHFLTVVMNVHDTSWHSQCAMVWRGGGLQCDGDRSARPLLRGPVQLLQSQV